jgi:hypothetical protein
VYYQKLSPGAKEFLKGYFYPGNYFFMEENYEVFTVLGFDFFVNHVCK